MLLDYQTLVIDLVRDDAARITPAQRDSAIARAVLRYSEDRPVDKVEDITGASGQTLALPAGWVAGFSVLKSLESPVGDIPPTFIPVDQWAQYRTPSGEAIQLQNGLPAASTVRATYTTRHTLDASTDTIPLGDRDAVASYAASLLCGQLATFYANDSDSTIQADRVAQTSRSQAYRTRERDLRKAYTDALGVEDKEATPGGVVVQISEARRRQTFFHRQS